MTSIVRLFLSLALGLALAVVAAVPAAAAITPFEITHFDGATFDESGEPANRAGSHPHLATTSFSLATVVTLGGGQYPAEDLKDAFVDLPPGVLGNPQALEECSDDQLKGTFVDSMPRCPAGSQLGKITIWQDGNRGTPGHPVAGAAPLFNMTPPKGVPAVFGFNFSGTVFHLGAELRTGGDYGVTVTSVNNPSTIPFEGVDVEVWGVPADPIHDPERGYSDDHTTPCLSTPDPECTNSFPGTARPFFTLPTSCEGPLATVLRASGWNGGRDSASFLSHDNALPTPNPIGIEDCADLDFAPTIKATPTTTAADSPSGLDFALHLPQNEDPDLTAEAHLHEAVVTLPVGMAVNPAAANGLGACSPAQIDLNGDGPAQCPAASKIGTVEVDTPLLDHTVPGALYIATPRQNPFDSLLAVYIVLDDLEAGIVVKLAGKVSSNPVNGQLTTTFAENPQLPFEDLRLKLFAGATAALRTPALCGSYTTTSSLTPWSAPESGPPATPSSAFAVGQGPGGAPCASAQAELPQAPYFDAGSTLPTAATFAPFVADLKREDGSQELSSVSLSLPPGLLGKLVGIPYCPEAALAMAAAKTGTEEQAAPSCPTASEVGSTVAAAGAGPKPYYAPGRAYLAGPYKGASLSLAFVTPAVAGPFDLGTVVVRTALRVDPETARITAVSDAIPGILEGIPLDIRAIQVKLDRPQFTLNPSSCEPMAVSGQWFSTLGLASPLSRHFQVGGCRGLAFKPHLSLRLQGGIKRGANPGLRATLTMPKGANANVASLSVALPRSEFLDQAHIRTICTRVQFAADACPKGSVYGHAKVITTLLEEPLSGPVYLRSSSHELPDLVIDLRGQVHVALVGRIDSVRGGIRTTFEATPDAPFDKVVLRMRGGAKGLLVNSREICRHKNRGTAVFVAQNGKALDFRPVLKARCKAQGRR